MIPFPVFWNKYTATMDGRAVKLVSCENCSTEYVYVIERQGSGVGTSVYMLNEEGAEAHATSAAADTLKSVLENDFDPVPCPACGHYQRYMFPKIMEPKWLWIQALMLGLIMSGFIDAVIAVRWTGAYLQHPSEQAFGNMVTAWSVLLLLCLMGFGLSIVKRFKIRHFDPNSEGEQARMAIARSRAITRAEFEKAQQEKTVKLSPE